MGASEEMTWEQSPQRGLFGEVSFMLDKFEKEGHGHIWCVGFNAFFDKVDMGDGTSHWRVSYVVDDGDRLTAGGIRECIDSVRAIEAVVALRNVAGGKQLC